MDSPAPSASRKLGLVLAVGLLYPLVHAVLYAARFGTDKPEGAGFSDIAYGLGMFYVVGCLAAWILLSSLFRQRRRKAYVVLSYAPFLLASVYASVIGGLHGPVGVIVAGLAPLFFPWLLWRLVPRPREPSPEAGERAGSDGG